MNKLYDRIDWNNNTTPALNESNLNAMSKAIDDIDDRVIEIAADVTTAVPELEELAEKLEAMTANPPYIGENGDWYIWDIEDGEYVDSGVDASISVTIQDVTAIAPDATPYVTNTGTDTDPIFHLFIPRGQTGQNGQDGQDGADGQDGVSPTVTIATITGGHSVTITDATHPSGQTFNVMDGTGSGDMLKSVYDSTNAVATAGGIVAYIDNVITSALTASY